MLEKIILDARELNFIEGVLGNVAEDYKKNLALADYNFAKDLRLKIRKLREIGRGSNESILWL